MRFRMNMVTLGVADTARSREFYEALGVVGTGGTEDEPVFFQCADTLLALWDRASLAADSGVSDDPGGWGGITLAACVDSPDEVDEFVEVARRAGGTVEREPADTFWGGYSAIVADLDGHRWEIAHNPHWTTTPDGGVLLA